MVLTKTRLPLEDAATEVNAYLRRIRQARRDVWTQNVCLSVLVVFVSGALFLATDNPGVFMLGLALFLLVVVNWRVRKKPLDRIEAKARFLADFLAIFQDELHPRAPIRFRLDLRAYDEPDKLERTVRSIAGHPKRYHSDKWLHLRLVLADRTVLDVVRQLGVKTKRGVIVVEKRRLFLTFRPDERRYAPMQGKHEADRLRWALRHTVTTRFHNPPESFHARVEHHEQDLEVRVTQEDTEILPAEVHALVGCVMEHLAKRCVAAR